MEIMFLLLCVFVVGIGGVGVVVLVFFKLVLFDV